MGTRERTRKLGRGLSSLVGDPVSVHIEPEAPREEVGQATTSHGGLSMVRVSEITPSPFQARESFDEAALSGLADSIRHSGMMQPVVIRQTGSGALELVAGERRWRAAKLAGLERIPAVTRSLTDEQAAEIGVVENVQREDLNPIERARAFMMLATKFNLTHAAIAERVGVGRPSVSNSVRLLDLEPELQALVADGRLSTGHAKVLLSLTSGSERREIGERAATSGWSVRRLEHEVGRLLQAHSKPTTARSVTAHLAELERQLSEHMGTQVRIRADASGQRGRIEIAFYDLDHFDGLMSRLGFKMS